MTRTPEEPAVTPPGGPAGPPGGGSRRFPALRTAAESREPRAERRLRGARATALALAVALVALLAAAEPAAAQTEVWSATLTPGDLGSPLGCSNGVVNKNCSDTSFLSEDSFTHDSTDYTITALFLRSSGRFEFHVDTDFTTGTGALTLVVGSTSLVLADADITTARQRQWDSSGVSLTAGTDIAVKLIVPGTANTAPTAANNTVTTGEDRPYTFEADDFGFDDADGNTLASVKIVTPPAVGTLALDGTPVMADALVTKTRIDADMLTFTPAANASGSPYTTFTFKVNDGTVDSVEAYTMAVNVKANTAATGAPAITGPAQVGMVLTASPGTIADADGLTAAPGIIVDVDGQTGVSYSYQWIRVNGTDEIDIPGGTFSTYTPVEDDAGKTLKVRASFTDDAGFAEQRTSAPTATVTVPCAAPAFGDRRRIWHAMLTVGEYNRFGSTYQGYHYTVPAGGLDDRTFTIGTNDYEFSTILVHLPSGKLLVSLSAELTALELAALRLNVCEMVYDFSDRGGTLRTYSWDGSLDWSSVGSRTLYLSLPANNVATGVPAITGTAKVGQDLGVDLTPVADADGLTGFYTYQWVRVDADGTSNPTDIAGGTAATYTLTADDLGKKVKVEVSFTDNLSGEEDLESKAFPLRGTLVVTTPANNAPTASNAGVTTNEDMARAFATADFSFADADGDTLESVTVVTLPEAGMLTLDGLDVTENQVVTNEDIDARKLVFTPAENASGDAYASFNFKVSDGTDESASTYTMTVNVRANTVATGAPAITGAAQVGMVLTASPGTIADADGLTGVSYSYQWIQVDGTDEMDIVGASSSTYTPVEDDADKTLKVRASFTDDAGFAEQRTSAPTVMVPCAAPVFGDRRRIWRAMLTVGEYNRFGSTYQGYHYTVPAGGLDDRTFTIGTNDYEFSTILVHLPSGKLLVSLSAELTALELAALRLNVCEMVYDFSDRGGTLRTYSWDGSLDWSSVGSRTLYLSLPANNVATGVPVITGTAKVGQELSVDLTRIADADGLTGVTYNYQWVRVDADGTSDPVDITDATGDTYTLTAADVGKQVKVKVSFTDNLGGKEDLESEAFPLPTSVNNAATGAPAITGTAQVGMVLTASPGTIADADGLTGVSYSYQWIQVDGADEMDIDGATLSTYTPVEDDAGKTFKVRASFTDDVGYAEQRISDAYPASETVKAARNAAPSFTSPAAFDAAENQTAVGTVQASDSDGGDSVTGYAIQGGADESKFSIVAASGVLTFVSAPNFEAATDADGDNDYVVVVRATSGTGARVKTADQTITVTVTDVAGEAPGVPAKPTVSTASVTSVTVTWTAPSNAGPAITDYDYRYRVKSPQGSWTEVTSTTVTALSATITELAENTEYDVQVRATNAEGTSGWSAEGSGSTDANAAPSFTSPAAFDAAENQTAVGTVQASDSDGGDGVTGYAIQGGADESKFSIVAASGVLTFVSAPNFEAATDADGDNDYVVVVRATSGTGARVKTADQTITVTVTDVAGEAPGVPAKPTVSAASVTSVTVSWTAPSNAGPAITDYDYRYRVKSPQGSWTEVTSTTVTALTATITGLAENTEYDVQVRATNAEGTSGWSAEGSGSTDANAAPSFTSPAAFDAAENQTAVGTVQASDSNGGDGVTGYAIQGGADESKFSIVAASGVLTFVSAPNFEAATDADGDNDYVVVVRATSGTGARVKTADQTITVTVTDVAGEAPGVPAKPTVSTASVTSVTVTWTAPSNAGPAITDYDYRYRVKSPQGSWTEVTSTTVTALSATITELAENTEYDVQVRATNAEGTSGWSAEGSGSTDANAAPSFTSPAAFDAAENQTAVGTVQASDSDGGDSVTGYAIQGGADESKFSIVAASGVLTFVSAPNFEAATDADGDNDYVVVVRATSGTGARVKTADQTITVTVTDANDPATGAPTISGTATVGQVLTASTTGIADADGLTGVYTYQWVRVDADGTSNPTDIAGATAATYTLTADDLGRKVKVEVSFTDDFGTDEQRTSAPTATVTAPGLITAPGVTGVTVTSKPAEGNTYLAGEVIEFTVAFTAPVTVTGTPKFAFGLGASTRPAAYARGSDSAALVFARTVQAGEADRDGISWNANALALDGGTITKTGATTAAGLTHDAQTALAGHRVDAVPPSLVSASVEGTALALTYDEPLDPVSRPLPSAYTVTATVGATTTNPAVMAVAVSGSTVTLTLDTAPAAGATVTVAYAAPASNPVQDAAGNDAPVFSGQSVMLGAPVIPPPPTPVVTPPGAPRNLRGAPGDEQVTLSWDVPSSDGGSAITRYEYEIDGGGTWIDAGLDREETVTGLTNGQRYTFAVRAVNAAGGGPAATVTATATATATMVTTPGLPRNLRGAPGDEQVTLSWDAPSSDGGSAITRYEYEIDGGGTWIDAGLDREETVPGLTNGRRYTFAVRAVNAAGGGPAATVTATAVTAPGLPRNLRWAPGDEQVTLSWDAPSSDGGSAITRYEYEIDGGGTWIDAGLDREETVTGLTNGQRYTFAVRAVNAAVGGPAATVTATVTATAVTAPGLPRNLRWAPGDEQVTLSWDAPSSDGGSAITRYEYEIDGGGTWIDAGLDREETVPGLTNGQRYTFAVRAVNAAGGGPAATVTATTVTTPGLPRNLRWAPGDEQVTLSWDAPSSDGGSAITRYEYEIDGGGTWIDAGLDREETVPGLTNGQRYTFAVRAVNAAGGGPAATVTATTVTTPGLPRNLRWAPGDEQVTLSWDAPSSDGGSAITRYEYEIDGSGTWIDAGLDREETVPGLTNGQRYTFAVRAVNAAGGGDVATVAIVTSGPLPPAWLARFGRTTADHVVDAVASRRRDRPQASHLTIGGRQAADLFGWNGLGGQADPDAADDRGDPVRTETSSMRMSAPSGGAGTGVGGTGPGMAMNVNDMNAAPVGPGGVDPVAGDAPSGRAAQSALLGAFGLPDPRALTDLRAVLTGSSFSYSGAPDEDGRARTRGWLGEWSAWGRGAATRFRGAGDGMALDGEVVTAMLGFDSRWGRWLGGVLVAHSQGRGDYMHPTASGGAVASSLTALHPYAHYELSERTSLWSVLGYGVGGLSLTPEVSATTIETDLTNAMGAFGGRTALSVRSGRAGRFELAVRSDARLTDTASEAIEGLAGAAGRTGRVRMMLEGSGSMPLAAGGVLKPLLEAGLRHDSGDAETGAGLEVGGGLGYAAARLSVEVNARGLLAHQDTEYEEWGFSGSIAYTPSRDGRGLSMRLGSAWGATQSGVQSLWNQQDASGLVRDAGFGAAQRNQVELRYGLDGLKGRAQWAPYIGLESGGGSSRALRLGVKLNSGRRLDAGLELGQRQWGPGADPEHAVLLSGMLRW